MRFSDRTLAILGIVIGVLGLGLAVLGLLLAWLSSPWGTQNERFCYKKPSMRDCFATRSECDDAVRHTALAGVPIIRECYRLEEEE